MGLFSFLNKLLLVCRFFVIDRLPEGTAQLFLYLKKDC